MSLPLSLSPLSRNGEIVPHHTRYLDDQAGDIKLANMKGELSIPRPKIR